MSNTRKAKLRSKAFTLSRYPDDLHDEYQAAVDVFSAIPDPPESGRDKDKSKREAAAQTVRDLNERLHDDDHELKGRLTALPFLRWASLKAEFPPRDDVEDDLAAGVDVTHYPDLIRACWLEPAVSDAEWSDLLDTFSQADVVYLTQIVFELNEQSVSVPKLPSDWRGTSRSG